MINDSCATDHVMKFPGFLPPFLHTASDQNWMCRRPGNKARGGV